MARSHSRSGCSGCGGDKIMAKRSLLDLQRQEPSITSDLMIDAAMRPPVLGATKRSTPGGNVNGCADLAGNPAGAGALVSAASASASRSHETFCDATLTRPDLDEIGRSAYNHRPLEEKRYRAHRVGGIHGVRQRVYDG